MWKENEKPNVQSHALLVASRLKAAVPSRALNRVGGNRQPRKALSIMNHALCYEALH
jgi:hypothetical protein